MITNPKYKKYVEPSDIIQNVDGFSPFIQKHFKKHIDYIAPNGKPISFVIQPELTDEQILYCYNALEFYLTQIKNCDLTAVANRMADNKTIYLLARGSDREGVLPEEDDSFDQPLYQNEIANIGSDWYINCVREHRCAVFEEVFHSVHGNGIGSLFNRQAAPNIADAIQKAMENALPENEDDWTKKGIWGVQPTEECKEWLMELRDEGSQAHEYVISVFDCYFGFWGAYDEPQSFGGEYICKTREDVKNLDPVGYQLMQLMYPKYLTSMFRIDPAFKGDFYMSFNPSIPYTHKSQYLTQIRLTGKNDINVYGNDQDNIFVPNSGKNYIDGIAGRNVCQFSGSSDEYTIVTENGITTVTDKYPERDFVTVLKHVDTLRFTDKDVSLINPNYGFYSEPSQIVDNVYGMGKTVEKYYSRYIDYIAPNGKPIRFIAHKNISDEQLLYCHDVLSFFLSRFKDKDGGNKVADRIADNEAFYVIANGADRTEAIPDEALLDDYSSQDIYEYEIAPVGGKWYMDCDYTHRDATFEEIFHTVHGYGIGVSNTRQICEDLCFRIENACMNALPQDESLWTKEGLWGLDSDTTTNRDTFAWLKELQREISLSAEYIVAVIDSYYGFWGAHPMDRGMHGIYLPKLREDIARLDPMGYEVVESFLPPYLTYMVRLHPDFSGEFSMTFDPDKPYTHKSRYIQNLRITGKNEVSIIGNDADNTFVAGGGKNIIDGCGGHNTVQFSGVSCEYDIRKNDDAVTVKDTIADRDAETVLKNIQTLRFLDKDIEL